MSLQSSGSSETQNSKYKNGFVTHNIQFIQKIERDALLFSQ